MSDELKRRAREWLDDEKNMDSLHSRLIITGLLQALESAERATAERCAKICEDQHDRARTSSGAARASACAAAIRREVGREGE